MTSPFRGLVRQMRLRAGPGSLVAATAALASVLLISSAIGPRSTASCKHSPEHALPPAQPAAQEAHNEPVPIPWEASRPSVPVRSFADLGAIASTPSRARPPRPTSEMDEVNRYLWAVYERATTKRDGSGDFTWKDIAAAARLGMTLGDYVIAGMDRDFREVLTGQGSPLDAAGIRWTILSAFRDDYRQGLATGYKARTGDSLHGGSFTTGGYGRGCAIDIIDADSKSRVIWTYSMPAALSSGSNGPCPGSIRHTCSRAAMAHDGGRAAQGSARQRRHRRTPPR